MSGAATCGQKATCAVSLPRVVIAVPTYRRRELLAGLLPQLSEQIDQARQSGLIAAGSVLVVDNDPDRSAEGVCLAAGRPVRYVSEPEPGVSAVRNTALRLAADRLLVFIDDDEQPEPGWLNALVRTWREHDATVVSGRVLPDYQQQPDPWIEAGRFFVRRVLPDGAPLQVAASNNMLIDLERLARYGVRFDPRLSSTGGEDSLFTGQLHRAGARMVWSAEAKVRDLVPGGRLTREWVLARARSHGNSAAIVELMQTAGPLERGALRVRLIGRGAVRVAGGYGRSLAGRLTGRTVDDARGRRAASRGTGLIIGALGLIYREYAREGEARWSFVDTGADVRDDGARSRSLEQAGKSSGDAQRTVRILGTHGVPASYGGFETAAEHVGKHLVADGWNVTVYCQLDGRGPVTEDEWQGMHRVLIPEHRETWKGTSSFDLKSIRHAMGARTRHEVWLTFGYNTAVFDILPRLRGVRHVFNMDGMEWTRARWGWKQKAILFANERFAGLIASVLIADHPRIARYLRRNFGARRVRTVAYGAHAVLDAPTGPATELGLVPGEYAMVVCRPVPENSVLEIVQAWSRRARGRTLVVVGPFEAEDDYRRKVRAAASDEVVFPGPIFDQEMMSALRFHSRAYLHGHTVGGTNPSLVEAMAAGSAVIAHDNPYNRWVAGTGAQYFGDAAELAELLDRLLDDDASLQRMASASRERHAAEFTWEHIGAQYAEILRQQHP